MDPEKRDESPARAGAARQSCAEQTGPPLAATPAPAGNPPTTASHDDIEGGDSMDIKAYQSDLRLVAVAAAAISRIDIPGHLQHIERAEAVGPLIDPTLYRDKAEAMEEDKSLLEAALPLWRFANKRGHGSNPT